MLARLALWGRFIFAQPVARAALVAPAAMMVAGAGLPCCDSTDALMAGYGYLAVKPPSNLLQPGAVVAIAHRKPFSAALVCGPRASLGADWKPQESPTSSNMASQMNGRSMKLEANWLEKIKLDARFSQIQSVVMTMNRARIVELRDEDVVAGVRQRSQDCQDCIHSRLARGFKLTMIASSLSGDVTWSVRFSGDARLEGKAKLDTMDQLALELGGNATNVSESEIRAVDLVWAVRDDSYLASLGLPDTLLPTPDVRPEGYSSLLPMASAARILPIPDAEVVMPSDRRPSLDGYTQALDRLERVYRQPTRPLPEGAPIFDPRHRPAQRFQDYLPMERAPSGVPLGYGGRGHSIGSQQSTGSRPSPDSRRPSEDLRRWPSRS